VLTQGEVGSRLKRRTVEAGIERVVFVNRVKTGLGVRAQTEELLLNEKDEEKERETPRMVVGSAVNGDVRATIESQRKLFVVFAGGILRSCVNCRGRKKSDLDNLRDSNGTTDPTR